MGKLFSSIGIVGIAFLHFVGISQAADPSKPDPASIERQRRASALVGQSLQAEMDGDCVGREHFLREALSVSDQYPPARWYRGQVSQVDGTWLSVDDSVQAAKSDDLLAKYEAMRAQQPASVQGNWQAAMWCAKNNLALQCRAHLENILMLDHDNVTARTALGHQLVGNNWLTPADQLKMAANASFVKEGFEKYQQSVTDLIRKALKSKDKVRASAVQELQSIDDPLAIPVMESIVGVYDRETSLIAVRWLGSIDHQQAALSLARIAIFSGDEAIKQTAVEQLKAKSLFDFVPELLAAMSSPITFMTVPAFSPDGKLVGFHQAFAKEGMDSFQKLTANLALQYTPTAVKQFVQTDSIHNVNRSTRIAYDPTQPYGQRNTLLRERFMSRNSEEREEMLAVSNEFNAYAASVCRAVAEMAVAAELITRQAKAEVENRGIAESNRRIASLISELCNKEFVCVPQDVWKWWDEYNETNYQRSKSTRHKNDQRISRIPEFYEYRVQAAHDKILHHEVSVYKASCFVAGTKINTLRGLVEIEKIMPGDLVLSRHVGSGELCYKPVVCRTNREPAKTVVLKVDDDTIHSTTSHLLWVSGKGWTKAGDIRVGELLHAAAEPAVVMGVSPSDILPTHNLVVADTHTYFVGTSRVLSHDVLPRSSCHEQVPGQFIHLSK